MAVPSCKAGHPRSLCRSGCLESLLFPITTSRNLHSLRLRSCITLRTQRFSSKRATSPAKVMCLRFCANGQRRYLGIFARALLRLRSKYSTQSSPLLRRSGGHHRDYRHVRDLQGSALRGAQRAGRIQSKLAVLGLTFDNIGTTLAQCGLNPEPEVDHRVQTQVSDKHLAKVGQVSSKPNSIDSDPSLRKLAPK